MDDVPAAQNPDHQNTAEQNVVNNQTEENVAENAENVAGQPEAEEAENAENVTGQADAKKCADDHDDRPRGLFSKGTID